MILNTQRGKKRLIEYDLRIEAYGLNFGVLGGGGALFIELHKKMKEGVSTQKKSSQLYFIP